MRSFDFLKQIHSFFSEAPNGGSGLDIIIFPKATPFHQTRYEFPAFFVHVGRYRHTHSVCQTWKALKIWKLLFWRWLVKLNFLCPSRSFFVNNNLLNPIILIQFHVHPYTKTTLCHDATITIVLIQQQQKTVIKNHFSISLGAHYDDDESCPIKYANYEIQFFQ